MMQVKGSVVKSIASFVKAKHPGKYKQWTNSLPEASKAIYNNAILSTEWYPIEDGVIAPTEKISQMFYSDATRAAWESGYFSAEVALKGVYKVFVMITKPSFLMARASKILASFYEPTELIVVNNDDKSMVIHITKFPTPNILVEHRIGGWMEKALLICGCKDLNVNITKSKSSGDPFTEYTIDWK